MTTGFFLRLLLVDLTDEMKLTPLQERIIMLAIFRLAIRVLPDHSESLQETTILLVNGSQGEMNGEHQNVSRLGYRGCQTCRM